MAAPPGAELCPHCRRPFKRLRAHLPHCRAAPPPALAEQPRPRRQKQPRPEAQAAGAASLPAADRHLPPAGRGGGGAATNYLSGPRGSQKQMAAAAGPAPPAPERPICPPRGPGGSAPAGAAGLEWLPELYAGYRGLSARPFQEDVATAAKGGSAGGKQAPLSERHLMDVKLGELPTWLATCNFTPKSLLGGVQKAWNSYCNKYINVKRGGTAGISMLLAGYCVLSYGWNYQHIKHNCWRKYH